MGGLLILISMVVGTVAFISLIRPLPRFWLPTRKRAALVWIASFVLFATGGSLLPVPTPGTQSEELVQREVTTNAEVDSEATEVVPCIPRNLSEEAIELVRLYDQLHAFKDDPEFIRLGFGQGGPYSAWLQAIQRYRDTNSGFEIVDELGFLPGELMMLGMNYIGEDLSESDLSTIEFFEGKIQAGLAFARCDEIDPNWRGTIQSSLKARQAYAAEGEAQLLARESLLGRQLTEEELTELAFAKVWDVLGLTAREDEELALAQLRPLIDQMHEIGEQRKQEYEAALDQFEAAARAAEQGHGSYTATLAEGEAVLALATEIAAEMLALAMELADLEATAPPEVAALAATNRVVMEQAFAASESAAAGLQDQLEQIRALVAELSIDE